MATILSISSQVVYGAVGNSAGVFAMERLGHEVWQVPTVLLAHHPGYGGAVGGPFGTSEIVRLISALDRQGFLARCDAVVSGYLAGADQAGAVAEALARVKAANPDALYLCDPILGDEDTGLYVAPGIEAEMKPLLALADIATPNWFEFGRLAGAQPGDAREALALARSLGPRLAIITSAPAREGRIACLAADGVQGYRAETPLYKPAAGGMQPKGTGDVFAAILLSHLLSGTGLPGALARAAASAASLVRLSVKTGRGELALARDQDIIRDPGALPAIETV